MTLLHVRNLIGIMLGSSLFVFEWSISLILSQCVLLILFVFDTKSTLIVWVYTRSKKPLDIIEPETVWSGMIWRGFFMSAVHAIIFNSMSMASWFVFPTLINASEHFAKNRLLLACVIMILRIAVNLLELVLSSKVSHDM